MNTRKVQRRLDVSAVQVDELGLSNTAARKYSKTRRASSELVLDGKHIGISEVEAEDAVFEEGSDPSEGEYASILNEDSNDNDLDNIDTDIDVADDDYSSDMSIDDSATHALDDCFYPKSTQGINNPILTDARDATGEDWRDFFRFAAHNGNKEILAQAYAKDPSSKLNIKRVVNMVFKGQHRLAKLRNMDLSTVRAAFKRARQVNGVRTRQLTIRAQTIKQRELKKTLVATKVTPTKNVKAKQTTNITTPTKRVKSTTLSPSTTKKQKMNKSSPYFSTPTMEGKEGAGKEKEISTLFTPSNQDGSGLDRLPSDSGPHPSKRRLIFTPRVEEANAANILVRLSVAAKEAEKWSDSSVSTSSEESAGSVPDEDEDGKLEKEAAEVLMMFTRDTVDSPRVE